MPGAQHICLTDLLPPDTLDALKRQALREHGLAAPELLPLDLEPVEDEELVLFQDYDRIRGDGTGFFRFDEEENQSRRIDARTPLDHDPGPIEMPPADDEEVDVVLDLSPQPA